MNPPDVTLPPLLRRRFVGLGLAGMFTAAGVRGAPSPLDAAVSRHFPFGPVLPRRPAPALAVRMHTGQRAELGALLNERISAVQLMFTSCSATCPIQGALFAKAQADLGASLPGAQFVSLSIDPLSDTPAALAAWLRRFNASPGWLAAVPGSDGVGRLADWLGEGGEGPPGGSDPHTGQVYIIDRRGALAYRTPSMPLPAAIAAALRRVAERG